MSALWRSKRHKGPRDRTAAEVMEILAAPRTESGMFTTRDLAITSVKQGRIRPRRRRG